MARKSKVDEKEQRYWFEIRCIEKSHQISYADMLILLDWAGWLADHGVSVSEIVTLLKNTYPQAVDAIRNREVVLLANQDERS